MTLKEVVSAIEDAKLKRDFMHELTPVNRQILSRRDGTFEAVLTGNKSEKCLIPEVGAVHYLYRGQNQEFIPCIPTIYRNNPSDAQIFIERMRFSVFRRLLHSHPVVNHFFKKHHYLVDEEGLAQHYSLKTEVLDLTSKLEVALFFATCKYDSNTDEYDYYKDEGEHEAVLYVFDPVLDNEPTPPLHYDHYMQGNITPIGLQAFPRPGVQFGYALHIGKNQSTKSWMYKFTFTAEDSKYYYKMFQKGESLWIKDYLISKVKPIAQQTQFSFGIFNETYEKYRPKGWSRTKLKKALREEGIIFQKDTKDVVFSGEEQAEIINEWNSSLGEIVASKIVRKSWFEHDGVEEGSDGPQFVGIKNHSEYMTLQHIAETMMLNYVASPEAPKGSVWKNYTNTPRPMEKSRPGDCQWKKIPACMNSIFGKTFLTESDWKIN